MADFGVARHLGDISGITETNVAVGTVAYAAPEQLTGSNIDGRADQYALAATAFHLLTGAPPFQHENPIAVISQHLHEDPPRLSDYRPDLAHLDDVFFTALAKNPGDRFERCRAFSPLRFDAVDGPIGDWRPRPRTTLADLRSPRGLLAAMNHKFSSRTRWATALVCAMLIAVAATWSILYSFQPDSAQPNPALASRPSAPAPGAAPATPGGQGLDGTYQLTYDQTKRTGNGVQIRHDGPATDWWAFHSACTSNGCAATGTQLDDANHQVASTTDGGQTDSLRYVGGYWQGAPQQERVGCTQPNGQVNATQQETVAWSLAPQADGTLRGTETETVLSNECGAQGAVVRTPVVATRVGDVPAGVNLADPAQVVNATTTPAAPSPPVLGALCSDSGKLGYDPTNNEQVVCEGNSWAKAPITAGVHTAGSSCDRPATPVFAMSTSNDGYLLQCDPVTRMWTRPPDSSPLPRACVSVRGHAAWRVILRTLAAPSHLSVPPITLVTWLSPPSIPSSRIRNTAPWRRSCAPAAASKWSARTTRPATSRPPSRSWSAGFWRGSATWCCWVPPGPGSRPPPRG